MGGEARLAGGGDEGVGFPPEGFDIILIRPLPHRVLNRNQTQSKMLNTNITSELMLNQVYRRSCERGGGSEDYLPRAIKVTRNSVEKSYGVRTPNVGLGGNENGLTAFLSFLGSSTGVTLAASFSFTSSSFS